VQISDSNRIIYIIRLRANSKKPKATLSFQCQKKKNINFSFFYIKFFQNLALGEGLGQQIERISIFFLFRSQIFQIWDQRCFWNWTNKVFGTGPYFILNIKENKFDFLSKKPKSGTIKFSLFAQNSKLQYKFDLFIPKN